MIEQPITFLSGGQQVVGMFHLPEGEGKFPAVLMLHGFTGNRTETRRIFVQVARALARVGIASLRIDFRGCGDSAGEFHEMSVSSMCADGRAALAWLAAQSGIDASRLALLGMSLGGMVASMLVGEGLDVRAAVLWCPVTNPGRLIANRTSPERQKQISSRGVADMDGWAVGRRFILEMMTANPVAMLQKAKIPLLFIHGDNDQTVPHADSDATVAAMRLSGHNVALRTIAGADHCYTSLPWIEQLMSATIGWFEEAL